MTIDSQTQRGDLIVSSKVLGHISEGLYRGPAGALKELISNAFDANARQISISTGRPSFDVVSVRDDGDGMTIDRFVENLRGGIGDSDKRRPGQELINGRPMVGRLGIGLLAISQISHSFEVVSHHLASESAFRAEIWMKDYRKEILDSMPSVPTRSNEPDSGGDARGFSMGTFVAEPIDFDANRSGVTITTTDVNEGFRTQLAEDEPLALPKEFATFVDEVRKKDLLATGDRYRKMVWEISSVAPIPYLPEGPVTPEGTIQDVVQTLNAFDFNVILDGVLLAKPVLLERPTETDDVGGPVLYELNLDKKIWGSRLKVRGYVHGSEGQVIHPDDLRGVLIRIRHVGIGSYDKSLLDYRYAEGPRFGWLTGELYVEEGLEDALTIGRDGFDTGHPHYGALREWFHQQLRTRVFPALYRGITGRRIVKELVRTTSSKAAFDELVRDFTGRPVKIQEVNRPGARPVEVDIDGETIYVNGQADWPRGRRRRELAIRLLIVFELASSPHPAGDGNPAHAFLRLTNKVLSEH